MVELTTQVGLQMGLSRKEEEKGKDPDWICRSFFNIFSSYHSETHNDRINSLFDTYNTFGRLARNWIIDLLPLMSFAKKGVHTRSVLAKGFFFWRDCCFTIFT